LNLQPEEKAAKKWGGKPTNNRNYAVACCSAATLLWSDRRLKIYLDACSGSPVAGILPVPRRIYQSFFLSFDDLPTDYL
jgi:hypothetical protein